MPINKGSIVNNSYIFKPILILSTLLSSAVYLLVECTSLEGSEIKHQESIVDET